MVVLKKILVIPYDTDWPRQFDDEAALIRQALGDNLMAIHHVESTAVPGLATKPTIDIIVEAHNGPATIAPLEAAGYVYKGEWNIPFKFGFTKRGEQKVNLHLFEAGHPEIALNLAFRDHLRTNSNDRDAYADLKMRLLATESSHAKEDGQRFTGYNLGKESFIRHILEKTDFQGIRFLKCTHHYEWDEAKRLRQTYIFDPNGLKDPYTWTFQHPDHTHFVLYQGTRIVGYAHIQHWPNNRATLRIIAIDTPMRRQGLGKHFMGVLERWLQTQGVAQLHIASSPEALPFYLALGYVAGPFEDPEGYDFAPRDTALIKLLRNS